jgi:hypothetical protein
MISNLYPVLNSKPNKARRKNVKSVKRQFIRKDVGTSMKKIVLFVLLAVVLVTVSGCAAGPNNMLNAENADGEVAGFWQGLWHGFISPVTFIISLFNANVGIYEVYNNGGWYNFGFMAGVSMIFGGGGRGSSRARRRKR